MIEPGTLNRRITIQRPTRTRDDMGAAVIAWADVTTIWASRQDMGGRELARTGQVAAEVDSLFRARWPAVEINTEMRILDNHDGRLYEIVRLAEVERRAVIEITARTWPEQAVAVGG